MLDLWVLEAIKRSGVSQAELARRLTDKLGRSVDRAAVNKMVKGQRDVAADEMLAIADVTGFPVPFASRAPTAPVVGYVGAGTEVTPFDDHAQGAGLDHVEIPPGLPPDGVLVIVRGDSMYPRYFEGEFLYYVRDGRDPQDFIGRECVVRLADGRVLVKVLRRGSQAGLFSLESWNAPPIEDKAIEWAAPVMARVNRRT